MEEQSEYIIETVRLALEETKRDLEKTITDQTFEIKGILQGHPAQRNPPEEERYIVEDFLGQGAYGTVYSVRDQTSQVLYAMKEIQLEDNEINQRLAREISLLFELKHANIVRLEHAFVKDGSLCLIMEYVSDNLNELIHLRKCEPADVKKWLRDMLSAVAYLHGRNIIHRDLKPENILVNSGSKELKLADFGLARGWFKDIQLTPQVTTLLYRAPEILLGCENYTCAIDMWSVGCIFAELADFVSPFRAGSDSSSDPGSIKELIQNIFQKLGTPTEASWPGVSSFPNFPDDIPVYPAETYDISRHLDVDGNDLLRQLLCLNPAKRITAEDALKHPYLASEESCFKVAGASEASEADISTVTSNHWSKGGPAGGEQKSDNITENVPDGQGVEGEGK